MARRPRSKPAVPSPREVVAGRIGPLIGKALEQYEGFAAAPPPDDVKGFGAWQTACKGALGHLALLVKLDDWARLGTAPSETPDADGDVERLLAAARSALADFEDDDE